MKNEPNFARPTIEEFVELESRVWDALVAGDAEADAILLADNFVGVYELGFSGKDEHCKQLENGPTAGSYDIREPRILVISDDSVMLSYLAEWTRPGSAEVERMYVSSLWQRSKGGWENAFSQDTLVAD